MPTKRSRKTSKRTVIQPRKGNRRYVRRNKAGHFKKEVNAGRSLAADRRRKAQTSRHAKAEELVFAVPCPFANQFCVPKAKDGLKCEIRAKKREGSMPCSIKLAHSSSISMVPSSIPTNSMLIHGTALSVISANNFRGRSYVRRSAKAPTNICPSFLRLMKSSVSAKNLTNIAPKFSEKNIFRAYDSFPKVRELFRRIRDDGKRIVLASSGKEEDTKYYIEKLLKIEKLIDGYTSADDADRSKPAPDIFTASLEKLDGVVPDDGITVGDTRFDIEAAAKAGLKTIALTCGGTTEGVLRAAGAVGIYRDPADLVARYDSLP